jgi:hypothetical protein
MKDEVTAAPAQPEKAENAVKETEQAQEIDNTVTIPKEKLQDYQRKLTGSKAEALRLKAENERLAAEVAKTKAEQQAAQTGQSQSYGYTPYQPTVAEVAMFKQLAVHAGIPLKEELAQNRQQQYNEAADQCLQDFLGKHPEYANPGDPNSDNLWTNLEGTLKQFKQPENPRDYAKLLEMAHRYMSSDNIDTAMERGRALGMAQAKIAEQGKIGGVGGGAGMALAPSTKKSPDKQTVEDGFKAVRPNYF